jgi:hypothetical protein
MTIHALTGKARRYRLGPGLTETCRPRILDWFLTRWPERLLGRDGA